MKKMYVAMACVCLASSITPIKADAMIRVGHAALGLGQLGISGMQLTAATVPAIISISCIPNLSKKYYNRPFPEIHSRALRALMVGCGLVAAGTLAYYSMKSGLSAIKLFKSACS